ncbi:MAG TPA: polyketide cyclase / dehydrase and lipid transport [Pseudonocardiaceae bacterium]
MPSVDVLDETFIVASPRSLAAIFADCRRWPRFWPDLRLSVYADRGDEGLRWTVHGMLVGTMEVWLEPVLDGTMLHYYLRADPAGRDGAVVSISPRAAAAEVRRRQLAAKRLAFALKDELEAGREIGRPAAHRS